MANTVTIWRTWDGCDMAQSDQFHATKADAVAALIELYGVDYTRMSPDNGGGWVIDVDKYGDVHLQNLKVELTRRGIASALTLSPHR